MTREYFKYELFKEHNEFSNPGSIQSLMNVLSELRSEIHEMSVGDMLQLQERVGFALEEFEEPFALLDNLIEYFNLRQESKESIDPCPEFGE